MKYTWQAYIHSDKNILSGKPVIKGTRISVELIIDKLASGENVDEVLDSYPHLTKESIFACLAYAADSLRNENIYAIAS